MCSNKRRERAAVDKMNLTHADMRIMHTQIEA